MVAGAAKTKMRTALVRVLRAFCPGWILHRIEFVHYARILSRVSDQDEPDLKVVEALMSNGGSAIDVGANVGVYTKTMAKYARPDDIVVSVEPVRRTADILRKAVGRWGGNNVIVVEAAVMRTAGLAQVTVPQDSRGIANHELAYVGRVEGGEGHDACSVACRVTTVDAIVNEEMRADPMLIKIDVEGNERECIAGAWNVIMRCRPALLVEINDGVDTCQGAELAKMLESIGYQRYVWDGVIMSSKNIGVNNWFLGAQDIERLESTGIICERGS